MPDEYIKARSAVLDAKSDALDDGRPLLAEMVELVDFYVHQAESFAIARIINLGRVDATDARRLVAGDALLKLMEFIRSNESAITDIAKSRKKGNANNGPNGNDAPVGGMDPNSAE